MSASKNALTTAGIQADMITSALKGVSVPAPGGFSGDDAKLAAALIHTQNALKALVEECAGDVVPRLGEVVTRPIDRTRPEVLNALFALLDRVRTRLERLRGGGVAQPSPI